MVSLRDPDAINPAVLVSEGQWQENGVRRLRNLGSHLKEHEGNEDEKSSFVFECRNEIKTIGHFYVNGIRFSQCNGL